MTRRMDGGWTAPEFEGGGAAHEADVAVVDPAALRASALRQARRLAEFYRITPQELLACHASTTEGPTHEGIAPDRPAKYRHPVTGETWDGVGLHPQWMRQALLQDGYRVEELRINPEVEEEHHARPVA